MPRDAASFHARHERTMTILGDAQPVGGWTGNRVTAWLRARRDQIIVFVVLIAIWQILTLWLGVYWVGSPWGVLRRFVLGIAGGDLLAHASYTFIEALAGFVLGAIPAVL